MHRNRGTKPFRPFLLRGRPYRGGKTITSGGRNPVRGFSAFGASAQGPFSNGANAGRTPGKPIKPGQRQPERLWHTFRRIGILQSSFFQPRYTCLPTPLLLPLLAGYFFAFNFHSSAMSPEEFTRFLNQPPVHGRALVVTRNPIFVEPNSGSNLVSQVHEYSWNGRDMLIVQRGDGFVVHRGTFKGVEWDHFRGTLTRYAGTNQNDIGRARSPLHESFATLMALGIYNFVPGSARWNGEVFYAEYDMAEARKRFGTNPVILGRFDLLPGGSVGRLEYSLYAGGEQSLVKFAIDYRYSGPWGTFFPSHIARYDADNFPEETNAPARWFLFYELEVRKLDLASVPDEQSMNPDVLFPNAVQVLVSNDVRFLVANPRTGPRHSSRFDSRKRLVVLMIFAALGLPMGLLMWHAAKKEPKQQNGG
jgi:hypothetical protein